MTSQTVFARPRSVHSSPTNYSNKGGLSSETLQDNKFASQWNRGRNQFTKPSRAGKQSGKWKPSQINYKHSKNYSPKSKKLLHRLSPQSPSGTLLQRIGISTVDEDVDMDQMEDSEEDVARELYADLVDNPVHPQFHNPEPGEVERFLESVIGTPPPPPSSTSCSTTRPTFLDNHKLPQVNHPIKVEENTSGPVLYSPTKIAVNNFLPTSAYPLDQEDLLLADMLQPSTTTLEECRKILAPILLTIARAKDPAKDLDAEQCLRLLSDDQCIHFLRQAKEMRQQLSSVISQKAPVNQSLKRNRVDETDHWNRGGALNRFNSINTVVSDASMSGKDSEITLVDFSGVKSPPKAPRAMLQGYTKYNDSDGDHLPSSVAPVASSVAERVSGSESLIELIHEVIRMFPVLMPAAPSMAEMNTCEEHSTERLLPAAPPTATEGCEDFVSRLPTQPGIWFSQHGKRNAEIVDIDINVSRDMFYMARESRLFTMKMNVRLCSVPGDGMTNGASWEDVNAIIHSDALHWPTKGMVIQVNPDSEQGRTWLPHTLESSPLDVTLSMVPGKNTFRFIQLSNLSDFTFFLVASPPSPEEEWRSWDWSSTFDRFRIKPHSEDDQISNILSEFAHMPVTIRS